MSQTVELAAGTRFYLGRELVELAEVADVIFPNAANLDAVAETLAASSKENIQQAANLNLNRAVLNRQVIAPTNGEGGYVAGTALDVTYGPTGQKQYTTHGLVPALVPATTTVEDAADTIIVATFDQDINSEEDDYAAGFSAKVNGVARAITEAARQAGDNVIHFTLESAVATAHPVLLSYDANVGDIKSDDGAPLQSFVDAVVDNNVAA